MMHSLHNRSHEPTDAEYRVAVGSAGGPWEELRRRLSAEMDAQPVPSWGGRDGWELRYRRAGRSFVSLTPGTDAFTACVVLGSRERTEAEASGLPAAARSALDGARRYPDGTWIFLTVRSMEDVETLSALLEVKLPARLRRSLVHAG